MYTGVLCPMATYGVFVCFDKFLGVHVFDPSPCLLMVTYVIKHFSPGSPNYT